ncbi:MULTISPECIES: helix-turn-helix domain-containing protein [unclassified Rhodococcus (in: high G+C Gram-positive bacteria)]|uniref:helix-turn-helix domain-containing protein n=1 Tax=unclassified Rhodococcus (in: high G+C Gram-positive bacteria) TaxID=192944 RepID=UPI00096A5D9F|nr:MULTISPECIES: XRE family transcriptional regulator [unclassified Rhodococcus (in: high G+C Gram-positive bacteria)]
MTATGAKPPRKTAESTAAASKKSQPRKTTPQKTTAQKKSAQQKSAPAKVAARKQKTEDNGLGTSVGKTVRAERTRQGIPVRELARRLGVSPSFLSQFELGQSQAAVNTLFAIATELNLSLDVLLGNSVDPERESASETKTHEPRISDCLTFRSGVRWQRLANTPANHHVQFLLTEYEPGADSAPGDAPQTHSGDDYGYVLEGTLTIDIDGMRRLLEAGEAIHLVGNVPHRLRNETDETVKAIWFVLG